MSDKKYSTSEIRENLSHVKALTSYKTEYSSQTSAYFIIWGCIWIVAYTIAFFNISSLQIGIAWGVLGITGWFITMRTYFKQEKIEPMPLFLKAQLKLALIGLLVILALLAFLMYSSLLETSFNALSLYIVLVVAIMYLLLGIVLTKEIFFMGFWLSILGVLTYSTIPQYMNLIFAIIGGGSLLLTGFILNRKGQGNE